MDNQRQQYIQELEKRLGNDRENKILIRKLADAYVMEKRTDKAFNLYRELLKTGERDPKMLAAMGYCLHTHHKYQDALPYFLRAYQARFRPSFVFDGLLICLQRSGKIKDCLKLIKSHARSETATAIFKSTSAKILMDVEDFEQARELALEATLLSPEDKYFEAVLETAECKQTKTRPKIAFHMNEPFHHGIMKPIFEVLRDLYDVRFTNDPDWITQFDPAVVFVANSQAANFRERLPNAKFVLTRHGLISKNFAFRAGEVSDYICVSSETIREDYIERGGFEADKIWVTGYSQMDYLFRYAQKTKNGPKPVGSKRVLYAPTFTNGFSSLPLIVPMIEGGLIEKAGLDELVIKPHPLSFRTHILQIETLKRLQQSETRIKLVDGSGTDVMVAMQNADLLLSDVSSVMFEFLALDRPVIAFNHPDRFGVAQYDPEGIEWKWRDHADEVEDEASLIEALIRNLNTPSTRQGERSKYQKLLFGDCRDGRSGERIAAHLREILE